MWLVRNKDIVSYDTHTVRDNAVIQLTQVSPFQTNVRFVRTVWFV
jgi:hypothetical protein